jgi:hypothetical protein
MKYNLFTFKDNKLLCWRLGPISAVKQKHFKEDVISLAGQGIHKPPVSRGFWAFPYPHFDYFFCYHQWTKLLPKKYRDTHVEKTEEEWEEYHKLIRNIKKNNPPSLFYTDKFYSHIFPNSNTDYNSWYYWDSVRDWAKIARGKLITFDVWEHGLFKMNYSVDHLEIFIP